MTKIPVNIPEFVPNIHTGTSNKVQSTESNDDFSKILEKQKNAESRNADNALKDDITEYDNNKEIRSREENYEVDNGTVEKETSVKETSDTSAGNQADTEKQEFTDEELQAILPMLHVAITDVKELLASKLGITTGELTALMENMQISEEQLLNPDAVKELFLQAKGAEDVTALLMDENLLSAMQDLETDFSQIMENVQETLDISEDEMTVLKEQLGKMNQTNTPVITLENLDENQSVGSGEETNQDDAQGEAQQNFQWSGQGGTVVENPSGSAGTVSQTQSSYSTLQAENIMNQIMDYMKIQLDADTSTLEMQLQPETLGTLQIRISAKEGLMTAQFTTVSESVKVVLESQMVQLQQQLESQNIKVDAIEVTVQAHAFESALQQGENKQQTYEEKKNRTRRIDLNGLTDGEELAQEDRIVAEMMEANGNTVDYLA